MAHSIKTISVVLVLAVGLSTPALAQQGQRPDSHPQQSNHQYYPTSPGQTHAQARYPVQAQNSQGQGTQFGQNGYQGYGYQGQQGGQYGQSGQYRTYPTQGQGYQGQQGQGSSDWRQDRQQDRQSRRYGSQPDQSYAGNGKGKGKGKNKGKNKDKGRWGSQYGGGYGGQGYTPQGGHRGYSTPCPPGLMDKGCMPPGQAKKYQVGQRLPTTMSRMLDYAKYGLHQPAPGYYYSRDNRDVVMVDQATHHVVGLVRVLEHIL